MLGLRMIPKSSCVTSSGYLDSDFCFERHTVLTKHLMALRTEKTYLESIYRRYSSTKTVQSSENRNAGMLFRFFPLVANMKDYLSHTHRARGDRFVRHLKTFYVRY